MAALRVPAEGARRSKRQPYYLHCSGRDERPSFGTDTGTLATTRSATRCVLRERRRLKPRDDPRELLVTAGGEDVDRLAMVERD